MTNQHRTVRAQITEHNRRLDSHLRRRVGVTLEAYKVIKNVGQLAGAIGVTFAIQQGADPLTSAFLIAVIISGPEALEYVLMNDPGD